MDVAEILAVFVTLPSKECAEQIGSRIVEERLAACANIIPGISSIFRWEGKIDQAEELLMMIKTPADKFPALEKRIVELHPYDTPEVIAVPITQAYAAYRNWVIEETSAEH